MRLMLLLTLFHRIGNIGTEELSNLPKVTEQKLEHREYAFSTYAFNH